MFPFFSKFIAGDLKMFSILLKALRLPFSTASMLNFLVFWFALKAPLDQRFYFGIFGIFFAHLAANLWNDYFDRDADALNQPPSPFSGGSRVMQQGLLSPKQFLLLCLSFSFLAAGCAAAALIFSPFSWGLFAILAAGGILSFFYTSPPLKLVYRGWGEPVIFLLFGPLLFLGAWFLSQMPFSVKGFLSSLYLGLLVAQILMVNEIQDREADEKAQKNTWAVRLSASRFKSLFILLGFALAMILKAAGAKGFLGAGLILSAALGQFFLFRAHHHLIRSVMGLLIHLLSGLGWLFYFL